MKKILTISLLSSVMLLAGFKVGDNFPTLTLDDQFKKTTTITKDTKAIWMAFEKSVAVDTADFLKAQSKGFLTSNHILYISDISAMPSLITTLFALPKMKKYPFSVQLINDERGKQFDKKEGMLTRYSLKNHKITAIEYILPKELATKIK